MRLCWRICLAVLVVATVAWPKSKNLIINGSWSEAPDPSTLANLSRHVATDCWVVPAGKGSLAGWTIEPPVVLWYPKRAVRILSLRGKGSMSQTVGTIAGHSYILTFSIYAEGETDPNQSVVVNYNGQTNTVKTPAKGGWKQQYTFKAKADTTTIRFTGQAKGGGPMIRAIGLWEFDPEEDALTGKLQEYYKLLDRGEKNEADLAKHLSILSDDFTWQPKEGDSLDRPAYEAALRKHLEEKFKVNSVIDEVEITPGGAVIEVERREILPSDRGIMNATSLRFRHTWVRSGDEWKLKSSEEL